MARHHMIHAFWFGDIGPSGAADPGHVERWFRGDPKFDRSIRLRFQTDLHAAAAGRLVRWEEDPAGILALILLFDQFARNMYRDTPRAYMFDARARDCADKALMRGFTNNLWPIERAFVYMPYEHAEDWERQEESVSLFNALLAEVPAEQKDLFRGFLRHAEQHRDVIQTFGRFPWRNAVLGRESTAAERRFLEKRDGGLSA